MSDNIKDLLKGPPTPRRDIFAERNASEQSVTQTEIAKQERMETVVRIVEAVGEVLTEKYKQEHPHVKLMEMYKNDHPHTNVEVVVPPSKTRIDLPVIRTHDNQMLSDYAYCPRLYAVRHVRGLVPRSLPGLSGKSSALGYGSLIHEGLDVYYAKLMEMADDPNRLAHALHAAITHIRQLEKDGLWKDPADDHRTLRRCEADLVQYAKKWGVDKTLHVIGTETSFDIRDDDGFQYGGRIDLPVKYEGGVWDVDHKTTSRFSGYYFDNYKLSPQMHGYTWATGKLAGEDAKGVIINVLVVHKGKTEFERQPMLYSPDHIAQWKQRTIARLWQIAEMLDKDPQGVRAFDVSIWTPNFENCIGKYGPCSMFRICSMNPRNYETKLNMDYEYKPWDFTKKQLDVQDEG